MMYGSRICDRELAELSTVRQMTVKPKHEVLIYFMTG